MVFGACVIEQLCDDQDDILACHRCNKAVHAGGRPSDATIACFAVVDGEYHLSHDDSIW